MRDLVVIGGGEHARVVIEAARSQGEWKVVGYVDREAGETARRLGADWLGDDEKYLREHAGAMHLCVLGLGAIGAPRRALVERYAKARWGTVVHTRAWVSPTAKLAEGVVVMAGAVINTGASVGGHAIINTGSVIEHDVSIGAYSHVAPGVTIGGGTKVGSDSHLGLGSAIRDHISLGDEVTIGMGAAVVGNVSRGGRVMGVPARGEGIHRVRT